MSDSEVLSSLKISVYLQIALAEMAWYYLWCMYRSFQYLRLYSGMVRNDSNNFFSTNELNH
jgi:hypothetical protein